MLVVGGDGVVKTQVNPDTWWSLGGSKGQSLQRYFVFFCKRIVIKWLIIVDLNVTYQFDLNVSQIPNCLFWLIQQLLTQYNTIQHSISHPIAFAVFSIQKSLCKCYEKLASRLWPMPFTLTCSFLIHTLLFYWKIKSCCHLCFPQQIRPYHCSISTSNHMFGRAIWDKLPECENLEIA